MKRATPSIVSAGVALSLSVLGIFLGCMTAGSALAASPSRESIRPGIIATYNTYLALSAEIKQGFLANAAKRGLDSMVAEGVASLREAGELALADQFENEWKQQISLHLMGLGRGLSTMELGDFDPISPWLAHFYETLFDKTHGLIRSIRIVTDIHKVNYALGVVLRPNGAWRLHTDYDRIEFRKHFIPFSTILTYWVTLESCKYYLPQYKNLCGYGADELEHLMGRYVAPPISDRIFALVTKQSSAAPANVWMGFHYSGDDLLNDVLAQSSYDEVNLQMQGE